MKSTVTLIAAAGSMACAGLLAAATAQTMHGASATAAVLAEGTTATATTTTGDPLDTTPSTASQQPWALAPPARSTPSHLAPGASAAGSTGQAAGGLVTLRELYPLGSHWFDPAAVRVLGWHNTVVSGFPAIELSYESQVHRGQPWQHTAFLFVPNPQNLPDTLMVIHSSVFNPRAGMPYIMTALSKDIAVLAISSGNPGEGYYGITGKNYTSRVISYLNDMYRATRDPRDLPHVLMANVGIKGICAAEQVLGTAFTQIIDLGCSKHAVSAMIAAGIHPDTLGAYTLCYDNGNGQWAANFYYDRTNGGTYKPKDFGDPILEAQYALLYDPWEFRSELVGTKHVYAAGTNDRTRMGIWVAEGYFQEMNQLGYSVNRWFNPGGDHPPSSEKFFHAYVMSLEHFVDNRVLPSFSRQSETRVGGDLEVTMTINQVPAGARVTVVYASDPVGLYANGSTIFREKVTTFQGGKTYKVRFPAPVSSFVWYFFQVEDGSRTAIASQAYEKLKGF